MADGAAHETAAERRREAEQMRLRLTQQGYTWHGIVALVVGGPLGTEAQVKSYYAEKYDILPEHIAVIKDVAIDGGRTLNLSPGDMTVYKKDSITAIVPSK